MSCFFPLAGYYSAVVNESGKRSIVFDKRKSHSGVKIPIPCGQCIGCRLDRARMWAVRCMHEKRLYQESAFITLTYADEHLPAGGTLVKRDLQLFMKRLRKRRENGIRFYGCGEYGEFTGRPHYHVLLFNTSFGDRRRGRISKSGSQLFTSEELSLLWPFGHADFGDVTFASCRYVAGYCLKKLKGVDYPVDKCPEFGVMSRRPGIGYEWFKRFHSEAYRADSAIMDGREVRLPRYYDTKFEAVDKSRIDALRVERRRAAMLVREDNSYARRVVKDRFEELRSSMFARDL